MKMVEKHYLSRVGKFCIKLLSALAYLYNHPRKKIISVDPSLSSCIKNPKFLKNQYIL